MSEQEEDFFTGPWLIEYVDGDGNETSRHLTADYEVYSEERVVQILKEIHPKWDIKKICKVEKLPWRK